ncbi:hypothetical protein EDC18_102257 [Natranaerovirga pectinivora]|uniref:Uncharacterized protein n=1 Tax=Natranaerovirga pectinivora TaxID=682400 RepID=A0A4R3MNW5_9FIRM|nr:hypothetical protein [Natranaerovirga pectinivora]TCT16240.1 hypothetical protein EDC18_102257 [Natranaerovirga pectinivora]
MLYEIVNEFPNDLFFQQEGPLISLYQPTHRFYTENKQDPILFKNLIKEIEGSLAQKYSKKEIYPIMSPFYQIEKDLDFWNHTLDGLAIFATTNNCKVYKLHRTVDPLAIVAESFHIKPLIRTFQSSNKYQLLGLSGDKFTLYEGNRYGIEEVKIDPSMPRTIEEVLGEQYTDSYLAHGVYGSGAGSTIYHGHGGKSDEMDKDVEKFFRYVDRFVLENYSTSSNLPLILVSLKEYHNTFMNISNNPYLVEEGIKGSYDSFDIDKLKEKAWELIEPIYLNKTKKLVTSYMNAKASLLGSDNIEEIAKATYENRVETILIESEKIIPGKVDEDTGEIHFGSLEDPRYGDVLDDLVEFVIKKKGEVVVLPKERMPSETGAAAIYRY